MTLPFGLLRRLCPILCPTQVRDRGAGSRHERAKQRSRAADPALTLRTMNYRHAYHAGNFADVLKHLVLTLVIEHLKQKPAPFRVIDTHAGVGLYDLASVEAGKTGEWQGGIGRLLAEPLPDAIAEIFAPY